ncbi:cytochrome P450 monooxygenase-like protein [Paraphoma chrysanthemicola]|nr:cytochrome P450 monooxygenase-like protein [Paraphoma chrysanthemicola]
MILPFAEVGSLGTIALSSSFFGKCIYNLFFHPLKHIPGPFLARACGLPYVFYLRNGSITVWIKRCHERYGEVVRLNPNEVSFTSGDTAWPDIYGFRTGKYKNTGSYVNDRVWYRRPTNGVWSVLAADEADHTRMRRNLAHAFSEKALREQEPLVQQYVDLLVHRFGEFAAEGKPLNVVRWYNYVTFDIICDLVFGEPLHALRDSKEHIWISMVLSSATAFHLHILRQKNPFMAVYHKFMEFFADKADQEAMQADYFSKVTDKVTRRLERGPDRPDFFSHFLKNQDSKEKSLSKPELDSNAVTLMGAGTETTSTTLAGVTHLLIKNPEKYQQVTREIRGRFKSSKEITFEEVNKLDYMIACLQEGLRLYPPIPTGFPRIVPPGGSNISGHYIAQGTSVYVSQHATNHSARNFKDPEAYVPERWMGDEKYKDDKREVVQPFSFGPRNCLGKNLAYAEMRVILAKVLFEFDLEFAEKEKAKNWMTSQEVALIWQKPDLMVNVKPVQR